MHPCFSPQIPGRRRAWRRDGTRMNTMLRVTTGAGSRREKDPGAVAGARHKPGRVHSRSVSGQRGKGPPVPNTGAGGFAKHRVTKPQNRPDKITPAHSGQSLKAVEPSGVRRSSN